MRSNRAGRTSEINPLQMAVCEGFFFSPHHSPHGYKNQTFSSPFSGRPRPDCGLHTGQVRRLGCVGASILKHRAFEIARHHVGQVGHVGQAANNSEAYQRFFLPDMAFPMSGACRACRARPASWGIMRDGWKGMGRMWPVGGMGDARRTGRPFPWLLAFPGVHARPVASIRGRCGGLDDTNKILRIEKPPTRPPYRGRAVRELMTNGHTKSIAILGVKSNKFISEIYFGVHFGMPYVSKRTTLT